jgi:hypothetical protein
MTFIENLLVAVNSWNKNPIEDEWLFEKFREQYINQMLTSEAFGAIDEAVDILLLQSDESTSTEVLQTIISLARHSGTTEIPFNLHAKITIIAINFEPFGDYAKNKLKELFEYYRL